MPEIVRKEKGSRAGYVMAPQAAMFFSALRFGQVEKGVKGSLGIERR